VQVTVAEALLTLLQFALLLLIGWAVDVKIWQKKPTSTSRISNESTDAIVVRAAQSHVEAVVRPILPIAGTLLQSWISRQHSVLIPCADDHTSLLPLNAIAAAA
jgi:hypothetical protein